MPKAMEMSDNQKTAWIIGASSGIGRALALKLARDGWRVAVSARRADALADLAREAGSCIQVFPLDICDPEAVSKISAAVRQEMGPLALFVQAAGTYTRDTPSAFDASAMRRMVDLNLIGTAHCLEAVIPILIADGGGRIALVASVSGYAGLPGGGVYGATKSALITLAEAMAPDLARHGVAVSIVNPGFVRTPLTDLNDFPMPFIVSAEAAADHICKGLRKGSFEIAFPWQMVFGLKLLRLLPYPLFFALTRRMLRQG